LLPVIDLRFEERWTAPEEGSVEFAAAFTNTGGDATTDVHVCRVSSWCCDAVSF
jgi:hypothetical protein